MVPAIIIAVILILSGLIMLIRKDEDFDDLPYPDQIPECLKDDIPLIGDYEKQLYPNYRRESMEYIVDYVEKKKTAWVRILFRNGLIFMHSEQYENKAHARRKARKLAKDLKAKYREFRLK